ncbi:MAG: hypothetical protein NT148_01910 [Candidatus Nealsonbacteria bacterium]|nr:hypothetical protein [Candidatus Nealsonbacteria bacterium]
MVKSMQNSIDLSLQRLLGWIGQNGWAGYDPFSVLETPFFMWLIRLPRIMPLRILRYPFFVSLRIMPGFWLRILNCQKKINAKGMGLFAKSYLNLFEKTGKGAHLVEAKKCLKWLESNYSRGYSGLCWGYPFDWQSYVFIPKGTPSGVVTFTVGDSFWKAYKLLGDKRYLDICENICHFFLNDLNRDIISENSFCFSYTPLDKMHVYNANMFVAEFLIRIGKEIGNVEFTNAGIAATNYTLSGQRNDGAWPYFGKPDSFCVVVDNYHSGFVLRMMYSIYELTGRLDVKDAVKKGFEYYLNNLFEDNMLPKYSDKATCPIDIHACSEGILCLSKLCKLDRRASEILRNLINWTIGNMQDKDGHFFYMKGKYLTVKTPYIRWAQAWMLYALSENNSVCIN